MKKLLLGVITLGVITFVLRKILKKEDTQTGWRYTTDFDGYDDEDTANAGGEEEVLGI